MFTGRRAPAGRLRLAAVALCLATLAACSGSPTAPSAAGAGLTVGTASQEPPSMPSAIIPTPPQALGATRFLAFGDSITYGTLSSFDPSFLISDAAGSYPTLLKGLLDANHTPAPFVVVNEGYPGERARQGVDRMPGRLSTHRPQVVLLLEGINDMTFGDSAQQAAGNVEYMVQIARLFNCTVLVATMPQTYPSLYPDGTERSQAAEKIVPFNNELRRLLSGRQNVHIVDLYAAFGSDRSLIGNDGLHPTAAGYQRMAQTFHTRIGQIFPVRGSLQ